MEKGQIVTLTIEDMSTEGQGIGKLYEAGAAGASASSDAAGDKVASGGREGTADTAGKAGAGEDAADTASTAGAGKDAADTAGAAGAG